MLERAGIGGFRSDLLDDPDLVPDYLDMKHPTGTTRMSLDPTSGVVDADCRVHGIDNLYVAGSSVFPTSGHFNPTLVIVALAARLAAHLGALALRSPRRSARHVQPARRIDAVVAPRREDAGEEGPGDAES